VFQIDRQIELPFVYDFDRALERLAASPVNAVDCAQRMIRIPMDEGNVVTLHGMGTTQQPAFTIQGALNDVQIEEIKSIFHFDRPLDGIQTHFVGTYLEQLFI
jgi:DNA-3-methyladenine glycosylase II